ncbi:MAG: hypothetical protein P1P64_06615 [Treponemataceae bacterium]
MKKRFISLMLVFAVGFLSAAGDGSKKSIPTAPALSPAENKRNVDIEDKLKAILPEKTAKALLESSITDGRGQLSSMLYGEKNMTPQLLPNAKIAKSSFSSWKQEKTVFAIENLYLYKKKKTSEKDLQKINNILHSVSTLEGIEYYSTSRKTMRTLYEKSYAIKAITSGKKTVYEKTPDNLKAKEQLVLQKDLTFGEYIYRYSYFAEDNGIGFVCENMDKLKYGFISLVAPQEMNVALVIIDLGDYLLAYANTRANFAKLPGISEKLQNSFSTRAEAIYNWFITSFEKN